MRQQAMGIIKRANRVASDQKTPGAHPVPAQGERGRHRRDEATAAPRCRRDRIHDGAGISCDGGLKIAIISQWRGLGCALNRGVSVGGHKEERGRIAFMPIGSNENRNLRTQPGQASVPGKKLPTQQKFETRDGDVFVLKASSSGIRVSHRPKLR